MTLAEILKKVESMIVNGQRVLVDGDKTGYLSQFKWKLLKNRSGNYYACAVINGRMVKMHRLLTKAESGLVVDHINRNTLDNRLENLRVCSQRINVLNSKDRKRKFSLPRNIHKNGSGYRVQFRNMYIFVNKTFPTLLEAIAFADQCHQSLSESLKRIGE
jgi:hypothetical protein